MTPDTVSCLSLSAVDYIDLWYWFRDNVLSQICIVKNNRSIEKGLKPNRKQNN